jgi:hypothetical protein
MASTATTSDRAGRVRAMFSVTMTSFPSSLVQELCMNANAAFSILLFVCFTTLGIAAEEPSKAASQPAIATYEGQVYNGDNMDPLLTTFTVDGKNLSGTYVVDEESGPETGSLSNCKFESEFSVLCTWTDKYGSGFARMLFSADYRAFNGFWGQTSDATVFPWNGVRKEAPTN